MFQFVLLASINQSAFLRCRFYLGTTLASPKNPFKMITLNGAVVGLSW